MPEILEQTRAQRYMPSIAESYNSVFFDGVYYPEEREDDMGESSIHINLLADFLKILKLYFKERGDVFLSGNLNVYPEKGNPYHWFAPDLLVAFGVLNVERSSYLVWREGVFPQVLFEIASEKTWRTDVDEKLRKYEELGAEEYYILDLESAFLPEPLMAYRRQDEKLVRINVADDRVSSPHLELEIVRANNTFRFYNPRTDEFLLTLEESEKKRLETESEIEKLKAEIERLKKQN